MQTAGTGKGGAHNIIFFVQNLQVEVAAADCWKGMEVEVSTSVFCHHLQVEEAAADG